MTARVFVLVIACTAVVLSSGCRHDLSDMPRPCQQPTDCPGGQKCVNNQCVARDAGGDGSADGPTKDAPVDALDASTEVSQPDISKPDGPIIDASKLDLPNPDVVKPDAPKPDVHKPDAPKPDAPKPDMPKPDAPKPDAPKPDAPKPDAPKPDAPKPDTAAQKSLVDDTFADFHAGTLSESGAKIYVSAKGHNVQMLDGLDLNRDGFLDLVFANYRDGSIFKLKSYIYRGFAKTPYFSTLKKDELSTVGTEGISVADLDADGWPDLVFSNSSNGSGLPQKITAFIYWGSPKGYTGAKTVLPTLYGYSTSAVADLNRDGYLDIVFPNWSDYQGTGLKTNSYIYWGSATGFAASNKQELPTNGAVGTLVADLDGDESLDVVFANIANGKTVSNSYIYWGPTFSTAKRTELPTVGAQEISAADLDVDGYLDLVFSNSGTLGTGRNVNSYIYWGAKNGAFSVTSKSELPTHGAKGNSVADVNGDGNLDIVFSNSEDGKTNSVNSYIYWGLGSYPYFSATNKQELPTLRAHRNLVADLNGDGNLDIAFANQAATTNKVNSYIYWGSKSSPYFSVSKRRELPTVGATGLPATPGSVYDRKFVQTFTSRVHDTGLAAPTYGILSWKATVPAKTALKFQLRSASSSAGLSAASWYGPSSASDYYVASSSSTVATINSVHKGARYIQYRATFSHDFGSTPVLDRVEISYY